jgi:putative phage-type endonuclease
MQLIYTEQELPQRSDLWLEKRKSTIGASEVGTILGLLAKYEKPHTAWKRAVGKLKPKPVTPGMLRGAEMEEEAKEEIKVHLILERGIKNPKFDQLFAIHPEHQFLSASFDGVDHENKFITELKCPISSSVFAKVYEKGVQDYYYCQVQQQLWIAFAHWGITKAFFASYFPDGVYIPDFLTFKEYRRTLAVYETELNLDYCGAMLKVLQKFKSNVDNVVWDEEEYQEVLQKFYHESGI